MKKTWQKKEIKDAKDFGGRKTSGSGNKWKNRGDVKTSRFLIEDKTTDKKSFSITKDMWEKLAISSLMSQRIPILSIKFNFDNTELIVISKYDFLNLNGI